jgi:hypothetical protein
MVRKVCSESGKNCESGRRLKTRLDDEKHAQLVRVEERIPQNRGSLP